MDFENDSFYMSEENTTLEEQNETPYEQAGDILPEVCGIGERDPGHDSGGVFA